MTVTDLPAVNATLNGLAGVLLFVGFVFIKQRKVHHHKNCMISAFIVSTLFLCCYLYYHSQVGSKHFQGQGLVRLVYFVILISHTILAAVTVPLALKTFYHAFRKQWDRHRRIARWTFPIWIYVSVTGVLVYMMLYQWFPGGG